MRHVDKKQEKRSKEATMDRPFKLLLDCFFCIEKQHGRINGNSSFLPLKPSEFVCQGQRRPPSTRSRSDGALQISRFSFCLGFLRQVSSLYPTVTTRCRG